VKFDLVKNTFDAAHRPRYVHVQHVIRDVIMRSCLNINNRCFPSPHFFVLFDAGTQWEPVGISGINLSHKKTGGMGPLYGENCIILTSTVFV